MFFFANLKYLVLKTKSDSISAVLQNCSCFRLKAAFASVGLLISSQIASFRLFSISMLRCRFAEQWQYVARLPINQGEKWESFHNL